MNYFSTVFRNLRIQKRLTQEELAYRIHVSPQTVSRWERNDFTPSTENLINIAEFFRVPINEFLGIPMEEKIDISHLKKSSQKFLIDLSRQLEMKHSSGTALNSSKIISTLFEEFRRM